LHAASLHGHLDIVKLLLGQGADVGVVNKANQTAAELASDVGQVEVEKFIAEYQADANIRNQIFSTTTLAAQYGADEDREYEGMTSLHDAAEEGNVNVVKSLLERGEDINTRNTSFETPLHLAAEKAKADVVRLLVERGAEVDSRNERGWTPLHFASLEGHVEVSRVLVDHDANVNARSQGSWTPMHLSAARGHLGNVKLLLECGADVHARSDESETPYHISLRSGYREMANLLEEGARAEYG
jgi:serine/threonine-protein phosphatase 6 regulatory ankyrin repeat subunit B